MKFENSRKADGSDGDVVALYNSDWSDWFVDSFLLAGFDHHRLLLIVEEFTFVEIAGIKISLQIGQKIIIWEL